LSKNHQQIIKIAASIINNQKNTRIILEPTQQLKSIQMLMKNARNNHRHHHAAVNNNILKQIRCNAGAEQTRCYQQP